MRERERERERERKAPFATTSFKKGGGHIFMGGLIFGRLRYCSQYLRRDCTMHSNRLFLQFIQWWLENDDSKIEWEVDEDGSGNVCYCHMVQL